MTPLQVELCDAGSSEAGRQGRRGGSVCMQLDPAARQGLGDEGPAPAAAPDQAAGVQRLSLPSGVDLQARMLCFSFRLHVPLYVNTAPLHDQRKSQALLSRTCCMPWVAGHGLIAGMISLIMHLNVLPRELVCVHAPLCRSLWQTASRR